MISALKLSIRSFFFIIFPYGIEILGISDGHFGQPLVRTSSSSTPIDSFFAIASRIREAFTCRSASGLKLSFIRTVSSAAFFGSIPS